MLTDGLSDPVVESTAILEFRQWLADNNVTLHPDVRFQSVPSGYSVIAARSLEVDSTIVTCPFGLAITPTQSKRALRELIPDVPDDWNERQLMCTYMCFHNLLDHPALKHGPYLNVLPESSKLRTPLHFTGEELEALKGTNLYSATQERKEQWRVEWQQCRHIILKANERWDIGFSWMNWLTAATYISSRAFPSNVLLPRPSLLATQSSHPVLIPGIDSLNHARGHLVSWVVQGPSDHSDLPSFAISIVEHLPIDAHCEILNNYGPKPNAELLLGYGFVLADNPDDTIVLRVGGGYADGTSGKRWEIGRDAEGAEGLWEEIVQIVASSVSPTNSSGEDEAEDHDQPQWSIHLDGAAALQSMIEDTLNRFPAAPSEHAKMRPDVREMVQIYVEGQKDILRSLDQFSKEKERAALESAAAQGIEIVLQD